MHTLERQRTEVLSAPIDVLDWATAINRIEAWASKLESRYVCICNAHSVVTASQDPVFLSVIRDADMATPDGAPVAWMMRQTGFQTQQRINGPDLMLHCCERAARSGTRVFLLGSLPATLEALTASLASRFPDLDIVGTLSPLFRALSAIEDAALIQTVNDSRSGIVFVSLGCPKQELWMAAHRGRINAVMIGVGAAFDFHAGTCKRAPSWMRDSGFEWLHRLASEPRRLWRRYLVTNSLFLVKACGQLLTRART